MVYIIISGLAILIALVFYFANNGDPYTSQSEEVWNKMLNEKDIIYKNIDGIEYKFGDILALLPLKSDGLNGRPNIAKYLSDISKLLNGELEASLGKGHWLTKFAIKFLNFTNISALMALILSMIGCRYLHIAIYLGGGWQIQALHTGIKLTRAYEEDLKYWDVYRFKHPINEEKFLNICKKYLNRRYDYISMGFNTLMTIFRVKKANGLYSNELYVMCSELMGRVYNDYTEKDIFKYPELTKPDDIYFNDNFECVIYDDNIEIKPTEV